MAPQQTPAAPADRLRLSRGWRWGAWLATAGLLGVGFWAWRQPDMVMLWETFLTLCGVR